MDDRTTGFRLPRSGEAVPADLAVGSTAERRVVPEAATVRVPRDVPWDVAASICCAAATGVGRS